MSDEVSEPVFEPEVGDPIIGTRVWGVECRRGKWVLTGIVYRQHWPHLKPLEARCMWAYSASPVWQQNYVKHVAPNHPDNPITVFNHMCGIYAVKENAFQQLGMWRQSAFNEIAMWHGRSGFPRLAVAEGNVHLWGRVCTHQVGWRAQFAYPESLIVGGTKYADADIDEITEALADAYGIKVTAGDNLHLDGGTNP